MNEITMYYLVPVQTPPRRAMPRAGPPSVEPTMARIVMQHTVKAGGSCAA